MSVTHPLIGQRVFVDDAYYTGVAIVLEYDPSYKPSDVRRGETPGPYYCHLLALCSHELCEDGDDCMGEECRGWYAIRDERL